MEKFMHVGLSQRFDSTDKKFVVKSCGIISKVLRFTKILYLLYNVAYPTTSHEIWRFIPHRGDYIPRNEAELWDKSHIQ